MALALVSLGSNLGDRQAIFRAALDALANSLGIEVTAVSSIHETAPIGGPENQSAFLNAAALLETSLPPAELLARLQRIEWHLGRKRETRWAARTLDLDLLLYDDLVLELRQLSLPHPRMTFRRFMLEPAAEVAPGMIEPLSGWSIRQLLNHLNSARSYIAVAGIHSGSRKHLAGAIAQRFSWRLISGPADLDSQPPSADQVTDVSKRWQTAAPSASPFISDFWIDQIAANAEVQPPADPAALASALQAARKSIVSPKLLILLDAPADWIAAQPGCSWNVEAVESYRKLLSDQLRHGNIGPRLRLDPRDLDTATAEATAAIQAMGDGVSGER